jgi:hypothetical protein
MEFRKEYDVMAYIFIDLTGSGLVSKSPLYLSCSLVT